jgi:tetratricopeptide (TPR) repeat protein
MKWKKRRLIFLSVLLMGGTLPAVVSRGQVLTPDQPRNRALILVEEQYRQGHYALAAQSAKAYLDMPPEKTGTPGKVTEREKASYYLAVAGLKADIPNCEESARSAIATATNAAYAQRISFALAQYYFRNNRLEEAIPLYENISVSNLSNDEVADSKFELAYCYFISRQFDKAEPLFATIKELRDSKYYVAGNYYYGLLSYNSNKYSEALASFEKVKDAKEYRTIVPYYVAEIYYFTGSRSKALSLADSLIKRPEKSFYDNELHLLAAQCLFEEQRYSEAKPYFEHYYENADKIRKEDLYEIAYTYYQVAEWQNAIEKFRMLSDAQDSLGQTSMYLLGDCYLKTGDKPSARNAFGICADMPFNKGQQEAAMILYARLSYEMGSNEDALRQANALLKTFPNTKYSDEANTLISDLLIKTNNYDDALKQLAGVSVKDDDYKAVFQKAAFGYAVQEYRKGNLATASDYFSRSLLYPVNADYAGAAYFWRGELAFHNRRYNDAITYGQLFIAGKSSRTGVERLSPQATRQHAYITMGYAAIEAQRFADAQNYFNEAQEAGGSDTYAGAVAAMREADAVFMQKNYARAITLYDRIIASGSPDADYARYQKGILLGLQGKNVEKIAVMQSLVKSVPPSPYANNARYEIGITYLDADKYAQALPYFHQLTDSVSDKSYAPKSWMKIGFIHQENKEVSKAIDAYKHVVVEYPASEERMAAMDALKNLFVQSNQPAAYTRLLKENNLPSADSSSLDSTYYAAAETQFSNGSWESARLGFANYLAQYPNGIFAVKAHYYRGESYFQLKKYKEAREDFEVILSGPWNDFAENSARRAAAIAYDQKDFAAAYKYYVMLRKNSPTAQSSEIAFRGLMKTAFYAGKYAEALSYSDSLSALKGISPELANEALFYKAKSLQQTDKTDEAFAIYQQLAEGKAAGEIPAEARYRVAEILLKKDKLKEAEDAASKAIKLSAGNEYWNAKSYLLIGEILTRQKDYFNAKATYQSVVKHCKIAEIKQEAAKKLDEVKKAEKRQSKLSE